MLTLKSVIHTEVARGFGQSREARSGMLSRIKLQKFPSRSFPCHYLLSTPTQFDAV